MSQEILLGYEAQTGEPIYLPPDALIRSGYCIGQQGSGKTEMMKRIALTHIENGDGVAVLSPHPDLIEAILEAPETYERIDDVIWFAPYDTHPVGLNVFDWDPAGEVLLEKIDNEVLQKTFYDLYSEFWGPRMEELMAAVSRTILYSQTLPPEKRPTMAEFAQVIGRGDDLPYREYLIENILRDHQSVAVDALVDYWEWFDAQTTRDQETIASSTLNKARPFRANEIVAHAVGQGYLNRFDERQIMDEGKILLVDLNIDKVGSGNVELLGKLVVGRLFLAATSRLKGDPNNKPFHIIADEFGFFATPAFADLQDQARGFGCDVFVGHQRRGQLEAETRDGTLTAGNWIVFTVNPNDAEELASGFDSDPPGPEIRGQKQGLTLANSPWDSLQSRAHERDEVNELFHEISSLMVLKCRWSYGSVFYPKFGIADPTWANFDIWGFPDGAVRGQVEQKLNQVLYLMMNGNNGAAIEPRLLQLGQRLFAYQGEQDAYGRVVFQPIARDVPLGADWGASSLRQLARMIRAYLQEHGQEMKDYKEGYHLVDHFNLEFGQFRWLTAAFARTYARRKVVLDIARLGYLLRHNPMWVRGGQPEPEYEPLRQHHDVTNEWANILCHLPKFEAWVRLHGQGEFHIKTIKAPDPPADAKEKAEHIRQVSRQKYGVDRAEVERAMMQRVDLRFLRGDSYVEGQGPGDDGDLPASGVMDA